jgi:hypothetical protein
MARSFMSGKRLQIDKANSTVVAFVAVAAFVTIFSLVASKALLGQRNYQSRVIKEKTKALNQLKANNEAAQKLVESYKGFVGEATNIISGSSSGTGDRDGDNARIVLDALPSKYDFPALATSLEKILTDQNYTITAITGVDDELNQAAQAAGTEPVEMPFQVGVTGTFDSIQSLVSVFERSIRPIYISRIDLNGSDNQLNVNISAKTYYLPEKTITITTKEIK